jgi:hypothetical protein
MTFWRGDHSNQDAYNDLEYELLTGKIPSGKLEMFRIVYQIYRSYYTNNNFSICTRDYHHGWRNYNMPHQLYEFMEELEKLEIDYNNGWFTTYHEGCGVMISSEVKPHSKLARTLEIHNLQTLYFLLDTTKLKSAELRWHLKIRGAKQNGKKAVLKERLDSQIEIDNLFDLTDYIEYQMEIAVGL